MGAQETGVVQQPQDAEDQQEHAAQPRAEPVDLGELVIHGKFVLQFHDDLHRIRAVSTLLRMAQAARRRLYGDREAS
ncbi:hypothetical protein GCM10010193_34160 [Kitasatospora atroaurantiaca]